MADKNEKPEDSKKPDDKKPQDGGMIDPNGKNISLQVQTTDGKKISVEVAPNATIRTVKDAIQSSEGIDHGAQKLSLTPGGQTLNDSDMVQNLELNNSTIYLEVFTKEIAVYQDGTHD